MGWKEIKPEELNVNPFTAIGKEWMLITAGDETHCNTMTASWGGMGVIWGNHQLQPTSARPGTQKNLSIRENTSPSHFLMKHTGKP